MSRLDNISDLPGRDPAAPRRSTATLVMAGIAAAAWPPLVLTLLIWPPENWASGVDTDWRLVLLALGLLAAPAGIWALLREHERSGRPSTRLGVVARFTVYGGLLAAALQVVIALVMATLALISAQSVIQGLGAAETALLIYGVGGLPLAMLVGISYALWAGLCAAFIAFEARPRVRNRLGLMPAEEADHRPV